MAAEVNGILGHDHVTTGDPLLTIHNPQKPDLGPWLEAQALLKILTILRITDRASPHTSISFDC